MTELYPKLRLAVNLGLTVVIGVLSSIYATQVTPNGNLDWSLSWHLPSFWILVAASIVLIAIQVLFYKGDEKLSQFADDAHCIAFARRLKLEGVLEDIRKNPEKAALIEVGKMLDDMGVKK
ncbi:hypothetical protein AWB71_02569 [Caballeronia peredens]|nr:hypothetical protein AWB71_02569 [Caballeronia peredens]